MDRQSACQAVLPSCRPARPPIQTDRPVHRHAGGRTGRRRQHARRLSPRPDRFFRISRPRRPELCQRRNPDAAGLSRRSRRPRLQIVERGAPAVGDAASVPLPAQRTDSQRRSGGDPVRPEARPRPAQGAVDRRRRPAAGARQGAFRRPEPSRCSGCARCGSIACSKCSTPPACGSRNWWRCRCRRRAATPA